MSNSISTSTQSVVLFSSLLEPAQPGLGQSLDPIPETVLLLPPVQHARQASSPQDDGTSGQSPTETSCSEAARTHKLPMLCCTPLACPQAMLPLSTHPPTSARFCPTAWYSFYEQPLCSAATQQYLCYARLHGSVRRAEVSGPLLAHYR